MRLLLGIVTAVLTLGLACVQFASASLFGGMGARQSLPAHLQSAFGARIYGALERIAPAPYVESMLAGAALRSGDLDAAERHALQLPSSPGRNELLAQIAERRGRPRLALEYYAVTPDISAVDRYVRLLARTDAGAAYDLENGMKDRLEALTTHPNAVAEAYWRLGELAALCGYRSAASRRAMWQTALDNYRSAVAIAPFSEKYLLAEANQRVLMTDWSDARTVFLRAVDVDPNSAAAYAGLSLSASKTGNPALASQYAARARALDPTVSVGAGVEHDVL